jgi:ribosomal protein S19E (S16A)
MAPRPLKPEERAALFMMRNRRNTDMRQLSSADISRSQLDDLVRRGWIRQTSQSGRMVSWGLTDKGRAWVDEQLDR